VMCELGLQCFRAGSPTGLERRRVVQVLGENTAGRDGLADELGVEDVVTIDPEERDLVASGVDGEQELRLSALAFHF